MTVMVVPVPVPVPMPMPMPMPVRVPAAEQQRRRAVDEQAQNRDRQRLGVVDLWRLDEALDALHRHPQGHQREHHPAREPGERIHFSRAERERVVAGPGARVPVRDERQAEGADVGAHVPPVRSQRHRAAEPADGDLADHHHEGEQDDEHRPPLAAPIELIFVLVVGVRSRVVDGHAARGVYPYDRAVPKHPVTMAVRALRAAGVTFTPHLYPYEPKGGTAASSAALGVPEHVVVKTLIFEDDTRAPLCILMHGDREVSAKNLARIIGTKTVAPCAPDVADRHSGYQVGGTSPFGLRRAMPIYLQATVLDLPTIYINGGARGFLVSLDPSEVQRVLAPTLVDVATE
jgi:Cys-tRNA(Pro) deacylase